jgi:hypothetical protein
VSHQDLLCACFGPDPEGLAALERCNGMELDTAALRLLPFLHQRWKQVSTNPLVQAGHRAYLNNWVQHRERIAAIRTLVARLEQAGVKCMLLKGAALALRHYRDGGLRAMGDFDILIEPGHLGTAIRLLLQAGWEAEHQSSAESIVRQARVRHAWQFSRGDSEHCDLHWRPIAQCNAPRVAEMFWSGAQMADGLQVPNVSDLFFHVCVHAMHWEWTPNLYWFADAHVLLKSGEVDWQRATELARAADMEYRFAMAVERLKVEAPGLLRPNGWQRREFLLLQKPCPLPLTDRAAWHLHHFRRLRPNDSEWKNQAFLFGQADYVRTFLDAPNWPATFQNLWQHRF